MKEQGNSLKMKILEIVPSHSTIAFPDVSALKNCETFQFLGDDVDAMYNELWREVKSK